MKAKVGSIVAFLVSLLLALSGGEAANAGLAARVPRLQGRSVDGGLFREWVSEGRESFYRPVEARAREFRAQLNSAVRVTTEDLQGGAGFKLVDLRSREEYGGAKDIDEKPGHIPKAVSLPWAELVDAESGFCVSLEKLKDLAARTDIKPDDRVVAYCRAGMRAAVGYLAFQRIGIGIRLYDGSYAERVRRGLPVEA